MVVEAWGTGRRDYSDNVEETVVPIIRSYQSVATAYETFTLNPGEQKDITVDLDFTESSENHFIAHIDVTVDANVLIGIEVISADRTFILLYGYQKIELDIPQSLGLSEVVLRVKNYGDVTVNGAYSHSGVQGTEKITPIPA